MSTKETKSDSAENAPSPEEGTVLTLQMLKDAIKKINAYKPSPYCAIGIRTASNKIVVAGVELEIVGEGQDEDGYKYHKVKLGDIELKGFPVYESHKL